jgi:hypothetical protein
MVTNPGLHPDIADTAPIRSGEGPRLGGAGELPAGKSSAGIFSQNRPVS